MSDGEQLDLGGIAVEVVALPGHSPGHLGVLHRESGTAIVMDAVLERGLYTTDDELISPPPYASVPAYRATIARLRELRPARLGTSHYSPIEGEQAVTAFLDGSEGFVADLDAAVGAELGAEPQPLEHYWRAADAALGPFVEMAVELAQVGRRAPRQRGRRGARRARAGRGRARRLGSGLSARCHTAEPETPADGDSITIGA